MKKNNAVYSFPLEILKGYENKYPYVWDEDVYAEKSKEEFVTPFDTEQCDYCRPIIKEWRSNKQCFCFANELADTLCAQKDENIEVPIDALKRLPYNCFYLDLQMEEYEDFLDYPVIPGFFVQVVKEENGISLRFAFPFRFTTFWKLGSISAPLLAHAREK